MFERPCSMVHWGQIQSNFPACCMVLQFLLKITCLSMFPWLNHVSSPPVRLLKSSVFPIFEGQIMVAPTISKVNHVFFMCFLHFFPWWPCLFSPFFYGELMWTPGSSELHGAPPASKKPRATRIKTKRPWVEFGPEKDGNSWCFDAFFMT